MSDREIKLTLKGQSWVPVNRDDGVLLRHFTSNGVGHVLNIPSLEHVVAIAEMHGIRLVFFGEKAAEELKK